MDHVHQGAAAHSEDQNAIPNLQAEGDQRRGKQRPPGAMALVAEQKQAAYRCGQQE
jgi:hypothetical protein